MAGLPLLDRVAAGDHVCWVYDDDRTRLDAMAAYVRAGLRARERVIYYGDEPEAVLAAVAGGGVDVREAVAGGQLRAESYLAAGRFDPDATIRAWRAAAADARREGHPGLRVIGDMTWAVSRVPGAERLAWYEASVNTVFAEGYLTGVCAYDRRLFDPLHLRRLICAHPGTAAGDSPYDPSISLRLRRTGDPPGVRLSGEADLSNRGALAAVVEHAVAHAGPDRVITLDVTGLHFADMAAARILVHAASAGRGRVRLVGCSPTLIRLLRFQHADAVPQLVVEARRQRSA